MGNGRGPTPGADRRLGGAPSGQITHTWTDGRLRPSILVRWRSLSPAIIFLLFRSKPQLVLQPRHDLTRTMMIKPSILVASQPARAAAPLHRRMVDVEVLLDRTGDQLPQLRTCQRGSLYFPPAASPDSGTTRQGGPR